MSPADEGPSLSTKQSKEFCSCWIQTFVRFQLMALAYIAVIQRVIANYLLSNELCGQSLSHAELICKRMLHLNKPKTWLNELIYLCVFVCDPM